MRAPNDGLSKAKQTAAALVGRQLKISVNRGRNKMETLFGCIEKLYPSIFLFRTTDGKENLFSYNDMIMGKIRIYLKSDKSANRAPSCDTESDTQCEHGDR